MPTGPTVCSATVLLPIALLVGAVDMEPAPGRAELSDVEERPVCTIQGDHDGAHYGLVMNLDGPTSGAVWAVWTSGGAPHLIVLPDCPASASTGMDACEHFEAHPGGHSWQLHDPLLRFARQAIAGAVLPISERGHSGQPELRTMAQHAAEQAAAKLPKSE
jgi:hypothetical protein